MRSRGETAIQQSWEEIIQFFQARGCAGTTEEIKRVVLNRIQSAVAEVHLAECGAHEMR